VDYIIMLTSYIKVMHEKFKEDPRKILHKNNKTKTAPFITG